MAGDVAGADRPFEFAGIGIAVERAAGGKVRRISYVDVAVGRIY